MEVLLWISMVLMFVYIVLPSGTLSGLWHELKLILLTKRYDWQTYEELMRADASAILDDDIPCGEENPGRPYNFCEIIGDHRGKPHRDGDDKEWFGRDV